MCEQHAALSQPPRGPTLRTAHCTPRPGAPCPGASGAPPTAPRRSSLLPAVHQLPANRARREWNSVKTRAQPRFYSHQEGTFLVPLQRDEGPLRGPLNSQLWPASHHLSPATYDLSPVTRRPSLFLTSRGTPRETTGLSHSKHYSEGFLNRGKLQRFCIQCGVRYWHPGAAR